MEIDSASGFWFFTYQASPTPQSGEPSGPVTVNVGGRHSKAPNCGHYPNGTPYTLTKFHFLHARKPAWAVVGQGYILRQKNTRGDTVGFRYTQGSSHSQDSALGVGISGKGFSSGYTTAGSHTSTATSAEGYPAEHRHSWFRTQFNTGQYRAECIGLAGTDVHPLHQKHCPGHVGGSPVHKCFWMIHSRGWFGGQSIQHPKAAPHTPRGNCAFHLAHADHGSAIKWSHGFELGAALGVKGVGGKASFNSTTHTGYDANAVMSFHFRHKGFLCGTNRSEAHAAILVQRANKP
jgi:hypothetical protein